MYQYFIKIANTINEVIKVSFIKENLHKTKTNPAVSVIRKIATKQKSKVTVSQIQIASYLVILPKLNVTKSINIHE